MGEYAGSRTLEFQESMNGSGKRLLFAVTRDGHRYEVYTDGSISGFGDNVLVENRYPSLVRWWLARAMAIAQ